MRQERLTLGDLTVDLETGAVHSERGDANLRVLELEVLHFLIAAEGRPVTQDALLTHVFGYAPGSHSHTVRTTIHSLRRKLEKDPSRPFWLRTERGKGYRLQRGFQLKQAPRDGRGHLIGREADIQALESALSQFQVVTIVGPPGVGKTRLAREFSRASSLPHAHFVDLLEARDSAHLWELMAQFLHISAEGDPLDIAIKGALKAQGPTLLVLDNLERTLDFAPAALGPFLADLPETQVIITSRIPLHLSSGQVLRLAPLNLPSEGELSLRALLSSGAGALLMARARAAGWEESPSSDDIATLYRLVHHLGGLPLAIELAAALLPILPPETLLDNIHQPDLMKLEGEHPAHHRSLDAAIDWSWQSLGPKERLGLVRISTFQGPFTLDEAVGVMGQGKGSVIVLKRLADASLIQVKSPGVFQVLVPIREFAARLASPEEWTQARRAHLEYFAGLGTSESLKTLISRAPSLSHLATLVPELRAALKAAKGSPKLGLPIAEAALRILFELGPSYDPMEWARPVLEEPGLSETGRLELHAWLGFLLVRVGRSHEGLEYLERARAEGGESPKIMTFVHLGMGRAAHQRSELASAKAHLRAAIPLAESDGLHRFHALGRQWLVEADLDSGIPPIYCLGAIEDLAQDLLVQGTPKARLEANHVQAHILCVLGRASEAEDILRESLTLARAKKMDTLEVSTLRDMSYALELQGKLDGALSYAEDSLHKVVALGGASSEALSLGQLGAVLSQMGRHDEAAKHLAQAVDIFDKRDMSAFAMPYHLALGEAQSKSGLRRAALRTLLRACWLAYQHGLRGEIGGAYIGLAQHHFRSGQLKKARRWARRATPFTQRYGTPLSQKDLANLKTSLEEAGATEAQSKGARLTPQF